MAKLEWNGVWTALITPMTRSGSVDWNAYKRILRDQKAAGVAGVIPCGTTGESPVLTLDEKRKLIREAQKQLAGSGVRVLAGTGTNDTSETVELSRWASAQGVDGILVVTPYYNKPSQAGLIGHYMQVAGAVRCPVVLYNVPSRTGVSLTAETVAALAAHPRIRCIKEATGNPAVTSEILESLHRSRREMAILSGDDATFLPLLSIGACGVISVASNLFPRAMVRLHELFEAGEAAEAARLHRQYFPLFKDLFVESNPGPIKFAMSRMGWCGDTLRSPLAPLTSSSRGRVSKALSRCGLKKGTPA